MLFTSAAFLLFLAGAVALHWALPSQRARLCVLLAASFWFYAAHHWPSLFLLIAFILVNYALARFQEGRRSRALLSLSVAANLLRNRIQIFANLSLDKLDRLRLKENLDEIGKSGA